MAVQSVSALSSSGGGEPTERSYTSTYRVITNNKNDGPNTARFAAGIPAFRIGYSFGNDNDQYAVVRSKTATLESEKDSRRVWLVTVEYKTRDEDKCEEGTIDNPLAQPPVVSGGFTQFTEVCEKDNDGDPILNSAGDPFDPPPTKDDARPTITIKRNEAVISLGTIGDFKEAVNSGTYWGVAARTLKMTNISWARKYYGTCTIYYEVTYSIQYNPDTWDKELLDQGFRYKDDNEQTVVAADDEDRQLNRPVLLDENGKKTTTPHYITKRIYQEKNFALLNLPAVP